MRENFDVFDFSLSNEDMDEISKLDMAESLFFNHETPEVAEWFASMAK